MKASHKTRWFLAVVGCLVVAAWFSLPRLGDHPGSSRRIACAATLKVIGIGLKMYASNHGGHFPPDLYTLVEQRYVPNKQKLFRCPSCIDPEVPFPWTFKGRADFVTDYWYCGAGLTEDTATSDTGLVMDKFDNHTKFGNICFGDGHVSSGQGDEWYRASGQSAKPPRNESLVRWR